MHKNSLNIPFLARILIIIQLCMALSCLLWLISYPFMGGYFTTKSELLLIESVMGKQDSLKSLDPAKAVENEAKSLQNLERFNNLQITEKKSVEDLFFSRKLAEKSPLTVKVHQAFALINQIPKLELIWICLSVAVPILLLLRNRKGLTLIWLLPLITFGYALNNQVNGIDPLSSSDKRVFPREDSLLLIGGSKDDLVKAWQDYLITHWAKGGGVEEGEFFFNLKRLEHLSPSLSAPFWEKKSLLLLTIYLLWNLFFAWKVSKNLRSLVVQIEPPRRQKNQRELQS